MKINIASYRLAFFLIALLLLLIILSALIPQKDISEVQIIDIQETLGESYPIIEMLGLDRIYYNPLFFAILALLAINLTAGNIKRFRRIYKSEKTLFRLRHIGSMLFHLSLLIIIASTVLDYLYKSEIVFAMTEGQTINDIEKGHFRRFNGPLAEKETSPFGLRLDEIEHTEEQPETLGGRAVITLNPDLANDSISGEVMANHPLSWESYEFHYGATTGYSPELTLTDINDTVLFKSFVRVSKRKKEDRDVHFDYVIVPRENVKLSVEVIPQPEKTASTRFRLEIERDSLVNASGIVDLGQQLSFDRYKLSVSRLRYWCYISAIKNPYLNLVFFGFWMAIGGMTMNLIPRLAGIKSRENE
jgi:hypothetical protein